MQRFARLDDGLVVEIIELPDTIDDLVTDEEGKPVLDAGGGFQYQPRPMSLADAFHADISASFEPAPAEAVVGWGFSGGAFAPPGERLVPIEDAKAAKAAAVNAKRDAVIAVGYRHNFGGSAGIRTLDQRTEMDAINWLGLKGVADAMIASGNGSEPIGIRDASDETFSSSATVVSSAMVAMGIWRSSVIAHSWVLKDAIAISLDAQHLSQIDLDAGWPE